MSESNYDVTPDLIEMIRDEFIRLMDKDPLVKREYNLVVSGTLRYSDVLDYGQDIGACMKQAIINMLNSDLLPDGVFYYNIAERLINELGGDLFDLGESAAEVVAESILGYTELNLDVLSPTTREERLNGLIESVSGQPYDEVSARFLQGISQIAEGAVSDTIKVNAEFQSRTGLQPTIERTTSWNACEWCQNLSGVYNYPDDVPDDVYKRHDNCRCKIVYKSLNKKTVVHSGDEGVRKWVNSHDRYNTYVRSETFQQEHDDYMARTATARAKAAREKRIATWARKRAEATN